MQRKGTSVDAVKLRQAMLCVFPEALNAIDVVGAMSKFIVAVVDSMMSLIAEIDQAIVTAPAIGMDHRFKVGMVANRLS